MKTIPLLSKEGSGVVNRSARHPLPPPQLRRGAISGAQIQNLQGRWPACCTTANRNSPL
jgi:hypothetical protein